LTMAPYDFRQAIAYAMSGEIAEDVTAGVKDAVYRELHELDPQAVIRTTDYFNHSFVPDFVLSWRDAGRETTRDVYVRSSMRSAVAARDIVTLGKDAPVLLALQTTDDPDVRLSTIRDIEVSPDLLVTDVAALTEIGLEQDNRRSGPLQALVRGNVVRGGRGLIFEDTARRLTAPVDGTASTDDLAALDDFTSIIRNVFSPDAATRLERAAQLLEIGLSGDTSLLAGDGAAGVVHGRLSDTEMRVLLPYLLDRDDVTDDPAYWLHLGSMLTLERLESMALELSSANLTPLVRPNLARWQGVRAALAFNADDFEIVELVDPSDELADARQVDLEAAGPLREVAEVLGKQPEPESVDSLAQVMPGEWRFHSRMLSTVLGQWRVHVTADGRRLKGRTASPPARWDDLSPSLSAFSVSAVALDGLQRRVRVAAERDADVYRDVAAIRSSIDDEFHVPEVSVRLADPAATTTITVSFTKFLAMAPVPVPAAELVRAAAGLLSYRLPIPPENIDDAVPREIGNPSQTEIGSEAPAPEG
jgi:hypothetical protein